MSDPIVLSSALRANLLTIKQTQSLIDRTTLRLATGLKVISALDNPQNYFAAKALNDRASNLVRRLDGIDTGIRTIEEAAHGVEAISRLLDQAETIAQTRIEYLQANGEPPPPPTPTPLSAQILAANPDAYWQLNDTAGNTAVNQGAGGAALNGTYMNTPALGSGALYGDGDVSAAFNGSNEYISIPNSNLINVGNHAQRTIELVFNADTTIGRQVLYEEGGATNAFSIYIDNGSVYVNGRDAGAWGPVNISAPIQAGKTYHVAFTFDFPAGQFIGYLNGEVIGSSAVNAIFPSHTAAVAIGRMSGDSWFHDGAQNGNNYYFDGRISDVALYNTSLTATEISNHADSVTGLSEDAAENDEFNALMDQITAIAHDAHYRGIGLLDGGNLKTLFNEDGSSSLLSEGVDFTADGLGIRRSSFDRISELELILEDVRSARKNVRTYGNTLANDLSILTIRQEFTQETIHTLEAGADDLTVGDENEEGANLLALQTRQTLGVTALSLAAQSNGRVIDLFA